MKKVTVFKVIGYQVKTPQGNFLESCAFWVFANTEQEAMKIAKSKGVSKKYWQTVEVIEKVEEDVVI